MKVFLCVYVSAVFIITVDGQSETDNERLCGGMTDYDLCKEEWNCPSETSRCLCKSQEPYCRCNNYNGEFYVDTSCTQKWTLLTFALVASLPGITLALIVGVTVYILHTYHKPSKSTPAEEDMFPGLVFASDVNAPPKAPISATTSLQAAVPMAARGPYSRSSNVHPVSDRPGTGETRPSYRMYDDMRTGGHEGPFDWPILGGSQQTLRYPSYMADSDQVFINPYTKGRNPHEELHPGHYRDLMSSHLPPSPWSFKDDRSRGFSASVSPADHNNHTRVFPRAHVGRT